MPSYPDGQRVRIIVEVVQELPHVVLQVCYVVVCELVASRHPCSAASLTARVP